MADYVRFAARADRYPTAAELTVEPIGDTSQALAVVVQRRITEKQAEVLRRQLEIADVIYESILNGVRHA
jgi:hypothetical protein